MSKKGLNIHKRKDGRWEGRLEVGRKPNGNIKYRSVYGKTYSEVKEKLKSYNIFLPTNLPHKAKTTTFEEILNLWIANGKIKNKGGTVNKYQNIIDTHITPCLGQLPINEVTAYMIN